MHTPGRGAGALRRFRTSLSDASYFLTLCTAGRTPGLTQDNIPDRIRAEIDSIESDGHWSQRAGVIMTDHLHLLVQLTGELPVHRCVARLKSKTRACLLEHGVSWQPNFYEHRIRVEDSVEDVVRYIFLNSHRDSSSENCAPYPWFWLGADEQSWFTQRTDNGRPFPDWLR